MRRARASEARSRPKASGGPDGRLLAGRPPAELGFTLLEVLGAVALLGILYTVLGGSAIEGLRSEAESRQRLEASLVADDRLAEIELALASGVAPPVGTVEQAFEGFTVATEVRAFERPPRPEAEAARAETRSLAARRAAARGRDLPSIFDPPRSPTTPPLLLSIDVVVRWEDGIFEREVRRTTYAVDASAVEAAFELLAKLPTQLGGRPGEAGQGLQDRKRRSQKQREAPPGFQVPLEGVEGTP